MISRAGGESVPDRLVSGLGVRLLSGQEGQFLNPVNRVVGDPVQHISQAAERLHAVPFAGTDRRVNYRRAPATPVTAEKQVVFPAHRYRPQPLHRLPQSIPLLQRLQQIANHRVRNSRIIS